ncbi:polysaccharide biosynthesis protein [Georgenia sp. Marseille-Q6866]
MASTTSNPPGLAGLRSSAAVLDEAMVREATQLDVLGRRPLDHDIAGLSDYLTGRRVLITGAGGSIGSELARQVHRFAPAELVLLDRDESALHGVQLSLYGSALLDTPDIVLTCIRDREALREVFQRHMPEIVFHAAALKHLPLLEQYPAEGWKTNVVGTHNLLVLSAECGVEKFVNISTDKAANPTSVLGQTKQVAEQLAAWYGENADGTYLSVRFGNVLDSRGSVLHTFRGQIARGGPVTVTHPDVTRYLMTIPEACELVLHAGAVGSDGEVLVLDMGQPVRILDVARQLIARSGQGVEVVFTGLRPNEKLHEELFSAGEVAVRGRHPLISHVTVPPLAPEQLGELHDGSSQHHPRPHRREPVLHMEERR